MHGKIASVSPGNGTGVIIPDEEGGELQFHQSALHGASLDDLAEGLEVEFLLGHGAGDRPVDGLRVVDVRLAEVTAPSTTDGVHSAE